MKDKIRKWLKQIFLTHLGRLFFVAGPLLVIGGLMSENGSIGENIDYKNGGIVFDYMVYAGVAILIIEGTIILFHAIKNTISDIRNKKK